LDKVADGRLGAGDPSCQIKVGRVHPAANRADRFDALKRLANDARDEGRRRWRRHTRADDDGGQANDAAVDEAAPAVLVDEHLRNQLAAAIGAFWGGNGAGEDGVGQGTAVDGKGGGEDELDGGAGARVACSFKHEPDGVDIDAHAQVEVVFRASAKTLVEYRQSIDKACLLIMPWRQLGRGQSSPEEGFAEAY
jgi:hypothetical protein